MTAQPRPERAAPLAIRALAMHDQLCREGKRPGTRPLFDALALHLGVDRARAIRLVRLGRRRRERGWTR